MANNMQGLLGDPLFQMGAGILANNTGHYGAFGPAVGQGMMSGMQQNRQMQALQIRQQEAAMQKKLYELKLKQANKPAAYTLSPGSQRYSGNQIVASNPAATAQPFAKINPSNYTPASVGKFSASGNYGDLVPVSKTTQTDQFSKINPSDYTKESIQQFVKTRNYGDLVPVAPPGVQPSVFKEQLTAVGGDLNRWKTVFGKTPAEDRPFGSGMHGKALEMYAKANNIPMVDAAKHALQTPRVYSGLNGEKFTVTPGLPVASAPQQVQQTAPGGLIAPQQAPSFPPQASVSSAPTVTPLKEGDMKTTINLINSNINDIADILNEAKAAGEDITGVPGMFKSKFGGYGRQFGIPIGTGSERLNRKLMTLQGIIGPIILNEKRLGPTEREKLRKIVGDLESGNMDEVAIRESLSDIVDLTEKLDGMQ